MRKKYFIGLIMIVALCFTACGKSKESDSVNEKISVETNDEDGTTYKYDDEDFILNLKKGLEARWRYSENEPTFDNYTDYNNWIKEYCIGTEIKALGKYEDYDFSDKVLADLAKQYFDALAIQDEFVEYNGFDQEKYDAYFTQQGYNIRIRLITEFYNNYGLTVSQEYQETLEDFIEKNSNLEADDKFEEDIQKMLDSIELSLNEESSSETYKYYSSIVENQTERSFSNFTFKFNLLDESGIIVDQQNCYIEVWNPGEKMKVEFGTAEKYSDFTVIAEYFLQ